MTVRVLVLTGYGINCEAETAEAFTISGASADIVHINELLAGKVQLSDYNILAIPGGFSFGDDIMSGKVLANKIKFKKKETGSTLFDDVKEFISAGKYIIGICNGFQVLTRLGLLPNIAGEYNQEVSLAPNIQGEFINTWCSFDVNGKFLSFLSEMKSAEFPIRHGEGRVIFCDEQTETECKEKNLIWLTYRENLNGSQSDCAGMCDVTGRVIGLMPHPEAYLTILNHPSWNSWYQRNEQLSSAPNGAIFFNSLVQQVKEQLRNK